MQSIPRDQSFLASLTLLHPDRTNNRRRDRQPRDAVENRREQVPPRKMQAESYSGPITISGFQKYEWLREQFKKNGVKLGLPSQ